MTDDIRNKKARKRIDDRREQIEAAEGITEADSEALLEFSRALYLDKTNITDLRHIKLLGSAHRIAQAIPDMHRVMEDRAKTEDVVEWIHQTYDNEETNRDYRTAIRRFSYYLGDEHGIPDTVDWVSATVSNNYDPRPDPRDMLSWDDVNAMIDAAESFRDKAAIALAMDAGPRSGELYTLDHGDVTESDTGFRVTFDGKTGKRTVTVTNAVAHLGPWLARHPTQEPTDPMWPSQHANRDHGEVKRLSQNAFIKIFKRAARRAEIEKPVTPTQFRKANAYWLGNSGMTMKDINVRQGRKIESTEIKKYLSLLEDDSDQHYLAINGIDTGDDDAPDVSVECPSCGEITPTAKPLCVWCGQALEPDAADTVDDVEAALDQEIAANDGTQAMDALDLKQWLKDNPDVLAAVLNEGAG